MDEPAATDDLIDELIAAIVGDLELEDVTVADIGPDDLLFGEGIGLDSIDALELVVMLERRYGIKLTEMETARAAFSSVRTLAGFIREHRT